MSQFSKTKNFKKDGQTLSQLKGLGEQELLEKACVINVQNSLEEIKRGSPYIREKLEEGSLGIISAYYDTVSGRVEFRV